jgi:hypothetical protein
MDLIDTDELEIVDALLEIIDAFIEEGPLVVGDDWPYPSPCGQTSR